VGHKRKAWSPGGHDLIVSSHGGGVPEAGVNQPLSFSSTLAYNRVRLLGHSWSFDAVLRFGIHDSLPLHVAGRIRSAAFPRDDAIDRSTRCPGQGPVGWPVDGQDAAAGTPGVLRHSAPAPSSCRVVPVLGRAVRSGRGTLFGGAFRAIRAPTTMASAYQESARLAIPYRWIFA
jgi:hypothetical protein